MSGAERVVSSPPSTGSPMTGSKSKRFDAMRGRTVMRRRRRLATNLVDDASDWNDPELFWRDVRLDLERCRRYERSFALVRLEVGWQPGKSPEQMLDALQSSLRFGDSLLFDAPWVVVRIAEATNNSCAGVVNRLRSLAGCAVELVSVAMLPSDGLTAHAQIEHLYEHGRTSTTTA